MIKVLSAVLFLSFAAPSYSLNFQLDSISVPDLAEAAGRPAPEEASKSLKPSREEVPQDLVNRFRQLQNDLSRIERETAWLRNDINRLESDARRIEQGTSNPFFSSDLRRMKYDMDRRYSDLQRLATDMKGLSAQAQKDAGLNQIARNIEWAARDLDNRFQFDITNAAQSLEYTVRRIDPQLVGYDAQWNASDLSRTCRDIQWKTRDMRYDAAELVRNTQP